MKCTFVFLLAVCSLCALGTVAAQDADSSTPTAPSSGTEPSASLEAEPPELRRLAGSYTLVGNQADHVQAIDRAIETATSGMGGLTKSIARKRLEAVNKAVVRLKLPSVRKMVTVGMGDYVVTAPLDGGTAEVTTPTGDKANASFHLDRAALVQDIVQSQGRRENVFRFNTDGQLVMQVCETSPRLTAPVAYELVYQRAGR